MKENLVSIVTPVYNAEKYISDTIQSVLKQTYSEFELLLIDDCSPDNSAAVIQTFDDKRIKYYQLDENSGAAVARNYGLERASGQYVAFIDSDDVWEPTKLEKQLAFMREEKLAFTYTNYHFINDMGDVVKAAPQLPSRLDYHGLLKNTAIACSTVVIDRYVVGDFRMPLLRKGQDTATWLKILRDYPEAKLLDEVLNHYRLHEGSLSDNKIQALKRTWYTYRHVEKLPFLKASYYFSFYILNALKRRM